MFEKAAIINADDFGLMPSATEGIILAHREGIVTSTTIMANMPDAEEAVRLLGEVPNLGVGVHLNASQGPPLSSQGVALAGGDGWMRYTAVGLIAACCLRPWLIRAVIKEFDAQIRWALDHGIRPTHLDSHRHAHGFPPIFMGVVRLARRYNIRFVRRLRERLPGPEWPVGPARQRWISRGLTALGAVNRRLNEDLCPTRGTWGVAHTGAIDSAWLIRAAERIGTGVTEIMVHPGCRPERRVPPEAVGASTRLTGSRERELAALCDRRVREAFERCGVQLVHYGDLSVVGGVGGQLSVVSGDRPAGAR